MMTVMKALLLMSAFVAVLAGICAGVIWVEKKFPSRHYDERQKQARGNAYRFSFWLGVIYHFVLTIVAIWNRPWDTEPVELYLLLFFGLVFQAIAFHIYCIFTHAALPMSENPKVAIGSYAVLAAINLVQFVGYRSIELNFGGESSNKWVNLVTGFLFLLLTLIHLFQFIRNRKE